MRMHRVYLLLGLLVLGFGRGQAQAASETIDLYAVPELVAIEDRSFYFDHGVTINVGFLPVDAFNKGVIAGVSYNYYFSEFLAWEIVNFSNNFNIVTDLKNDFDALNINIENTAFGGKLDFPDFFATTNLIYTPVYNKNLFFNDSVVHGEMSFLFGGGMVKFNATGTKPMVSAGIILRYFMSQGTSFALDVREHIFFDEATGANGILAINGGVSFQLGTAKGAKPAPAPEDDEE